MKKQMKTLEELTDSRLMFEKQIPPFGYVLILIVTMFMAGVVIWSIYTPKVYMIIAEGIIKSSESNYVMSAYTGEIMDCNVQEGQLVELGDTLFTIKSIDSQISASESGQAEYVIKATTSGRIHLLADYKTGMIVQAVETVAMIMPENTETILETYVTTADMARIHTGDSVQIAVDGLSESVYGSIKGTVEQIDSNLTTQETVDGTTANMFCVKIKPEVNYLISKSGDKADLVNGMTAQARIAYDKITYFNYVLEKLGFQSR